MTILGNVYGITSCLPSSPDLQEFARVATPPINRAARGDDARRDWGTRTKLLAIHNLALNILGYIPGVSFFSGCTRITTSLYMFINHTLNVVGPLNDIPEVLRSNSDTKAVFIAHSVTTISQIARGTLETFIPFGCIVNTVLDIVV